MPDTDSARLAAGLELFLKTSQNVQALTLNRHEAARQAEADMARLKRFGGKLAVDHYMHGKGPDIDTLAEGAKLLASAGLRMGWAAMLRTGVEVHLKGELQRANAEVADLLSGLRIEARPNEGIRASQVIGLHEPGGTRMYGIPEQGVEGVFDRADTEWGRLYLHGPTPHSRWQIEPFAIHDNFNQRATLEVIPPTV
ncbi:MAG TPA: hypothetical protein VLE73_04090 [Candidatus Saccharimonadales bacterium]|nr:hypothetical protein [Candidatus Saccharimonadales bacterium]